MNIYAEKGHKVIFENENAGYEMQQKDIKEVLVVGQTYIVNYTEVESYSTDVYLEGYSQPFNSVFFVDA